MFMMNGEVRGMAELTYLEAITAGMKEEMRRDERVFLLGEDVGVKGGVFQASQGLLAEFGGDRVLDTPLSESAIAGVGIGAAMYGYRPIAEMQFSDFILPAVNQIISEAARIRYRSNNTWECPIVIRAAYGGGVNGGLYHSQSIHKVFFGQPGLRIVIPSNPYDAKGMLKAAIRSNDPVLFFEHKRAYRAVKGEVPEEDYVVPLDKSQVVRQGTDITVMTYGVQVEEAKVAAEHLATEGISVHLLDLRSIYPLDQDGIIKAAKETGKVLLVTEDPLEGSIIGEVAAIIAEHCLFDLDAPIARLGGPNIPPMPYATPMQNFFLVNPEKIEEAMRKLAEF